MRRSSIVLPVVDAVLGTVSFGCDGEWHSFWVNEPAALLAALANPARPSHWSPEAGELVVTVARTGSRAGEPLSFSLTLLTAVPHHQAPTGSR
ncbi:hypothetical protein FHU41_002648 [Psychromicrobium silvestre]|uniref:Uncharacterized protein n=1 Tax=Psychromicrobium silvestre TaxID=1645614 RepID=A0A7Y9LVJ4_9MICC|nr:hypothetical protein [Psychromicrobium silvestre]NYE96398.1 hypothetical protein [Psychromicrobium silvestre]